MRLTSATLSSIASQTGFRQDVIEKVVRLMSLLNAVGSHPYLKGRVVLKGGTALNLFVFNIPRLSVDIDLNYTGSEKTDVMLHEKPETERALQAVFAREKYTVKRVPSGHAGGKWRLSYQTAGGQPGKLEVDLNFMLRVPLFDVKRAPSRSLGRFMVKNFPVLDFYELTAGKLSALLSRIKSRDLFDVNELLGTSGIDWKKLRIAFVVYGAMNRKDWRTVSIDDIYFDADELKRMLIPVLNHKIFDINNTNPDDFAGKLVAQCRDKFSMIYPFSPGEKEFLDALIDRGEIIPELITEDADLQTRISGQPMLQWKALNVRKHFNIK